MMHHWVVWCKSKKGAEEICLFDLSVKEISFNYDETELKEAKREKKKAKRIDIAGRAYDTGHDGSKATSKWQQARFTLHAGFTKMSLSRQAKFRRC